MVAPEKSVQIILPKDESLIAEFSRKGMVYVMDAGVKAEDVRPKTGPQGFAMQARR